MRVHSSFWEHLAKGYPSYKNPSMSYDVAKTIKAAQTFGIDFSHSEILDVGCGTGTVAIPLAKLGAKILGVDISKTMLQRLQEDALAESVDKNIECVYSSWDEFACDRRFDVVIASMSPAVSKDALFNKYLSFSKEFGIFVGWGGYKKNDFVDKLLKTHNSYYRQTNNTAEKTYKRLLSLGYKATLTYFETSWMDKYSPRKAREYAIHRLKLNGVKIIRFNEIDKLIKESLKNAKISISTKAQKGIVIWRRS